VGDHADNQSAAAAAGAVPHLMQLAKSSNAALSGFAVDALGCLVFKHHDNQSTAGAAGAVECMCNLLSSGHVQRALTAANTLEYLCSLADNARRAVSMGAVPMLLQLKARSGGEELFDQVLAKLVQISTSPPPMPSSEPAFAAAAPAPVPAPARRLAPGSRVRIEGLQGRPEMNGRTGVICGALQQASMLCQT
jgi:hypothetical protein